MTLEDLTLLDEAIAEAEGLLSAAEWYWIQAALEGQWAEFYRSVGLI
jgi:hypothetical protein